MSTARLIISVPPRRMLDEAEALIYLYGEHNRRGCSVPVAPVLFPDGKRRWDIRDLDACIDSMKTGAEDEDAIIARLT
jgi:hypothetical protein